MPVEGTGRSPQGPVWKLPKLLEASLPLLIFPGLWVCSFLLLRSVRTNLLEGFLIVTVFGFICYFAARLLSQRKRKTFGHSEGSLLIRAPLHVLYDVPPAYVVILIIVASSISIQLTLGTFFDSTGGESAYGCQIEKRDRVANPVGEIAAVDRLDCGGSGFSSVYFTYLVYVHGPKEADAANNLIFSYDPTSRGTDFDPPEIRWIGPTEVQIQVGSGDIERITEQRSSVDGINIRYRIGKAN